MQSQVKDTGAELVVDFVIGGLVGVIKRPRQRHLFRE